MSITYDEILESMETEFFNESGEYAKDNPETELRFKAVASEIYAACTTADFALKQAFAQTATGEYLDRHAAMRSIKRKNAASAKGTLTFSVPQELENNVEIPKGTVCSVKGKPLIQFATEETAVIPAGSLSVQAAATALSAGSAFNAEPGSVTVLVNPPASVSSVTNETAFSGGADQETDEALRSRVVDSYHTVSNGVNPKSFAEIVLTIDTITDALFIMDPEFNEYTLFVRTENGDFPSPYVLEQIYDKLGILEVCGTGYDVALSQKSEFSVYAAVRAMRGADKERLAQEAEARIREVCSAQRIGREIPVSSIAAAVSGISGAAFTEISADPSYEGVVACRTGEYLVLKDVQVDVYE